MPDIAARVFVSISSLSGHAGVVSSMVNATAGPSMTIDLTMSRVTMSRPSSGSWTSRSASRMVASVRVVIGLGMPRSVTGRVDILARARPGDHARHLRILHVPRLGLAGQARRAGTSLRPARPGAAGHANLAAGPTQDDDLRFLDTPRASTISSPDRTAPQRSDRVRIVEDGRRPGSRRRDAHPRTLGERTNVPVVDVRLVDVVKRFGDAVAVDHIDLEVQDGEFFSLSDPRAVARRRPCG